MSKNPKLREVLAKIENKLAPVTFILPLQGSLAVAVYAEAMRTNINAETLIAEAVRAYLGDA